MLNQARDLSEAGRHQAVVKLFEPEMDDLEESPTLALLYGIAQARLGAHAAGERWVAAALQLARDRGDRAIEARALSVSGAMALEQGRIDEASDAFMVGLAEGKKRGDHATVGRCSNNLGIIANLRGEHARAVGSYTLAQAAFQRAGSATGVAETLHNLAISYRDLGDLTRALDAAERAVREAEAAGNVRLTAQTIGGRAELQLLAGDGRIAYPEIQRALEMSRKVDDGVGEAENLRVLGRIQAALGQTTEAERTYRETIQRAEHYRRPHLTAQAGRDLMQLLLQLRRHDEAKDAWQAARASFKKLGAEAEIKKLDDLFSQARA